MGKEEISLRVVLDTNVLVSALVFKREDWRKLRNAWANGLICPLVCKTTTLELLRVLNYPKFALSKEEQDAFLAEVLPYAEAVSIHAKLPLLPRCRDENDQIFIELAFSGKAEYLVSGDKDLLAIRPFYGCTVISPGDFFLRLG